MNIEEMTHDDIIRMARLARWHDGQWWTSDNALERFVALVAEHEREACAKVCENQIKSYMSKRYTTDPIGGYRERFASEQCAKATGEKE